MRIGIDARLMEETGVGRYIRNLIRELAFLDKKNEYVVFLRKQQFEKFSLPNRRWEKELADVPWHSFTEQLVMPAIFYRARLDLVHIPTFNIPIFYWKRMVVTIHDLTVLHSDTGKASTLPWLFYKVRRIGYGIAVWVGLRLASRIIAVSHATKNDVVRNMGIDSDNIAVTHEGVEEDFVRRASHIRRQKPLIEMPYVLYVGNAYPHKNLEPLLEAFQRIKTELRLVLVGKEDYFYRRLKNTYNNANIRYFGEASEEQLLNLYTHAKALVFPSLMEGFGLPALEALSVGCPVICSDIPVFHEILGDAATYVNARDSSAFVRAMTESFPKPSRKPDDRFDWRTMAAETREFYEGSTRL